MVIMYGKDTALLCDLMNGPWEMKARLNLDGNGRIERLVMGKTIHYYPEDIDIFPTFPTELKKAAGARTFLLKEIGTGRTRICV